MTLRALIFDVDGTLADTEELHRQAFNAAFEAHGLRWHWGRRTYAGLLKVAGGKERIAHFIALTDVRPAEKARLTALIPKLHAAKTELYAGLVANGFAALREGMTALIAEARSARLRLAIATTTTPANVRALLTGTLGADAVGWFDTIVAGDEVRNKKPAPDVYRLALERLSLTAGECIAFEDSANGLAAARAAGLCTVVAPTCWTATENLRRADLLIAEFSEIAGLDGLRAIHAHWQVQRAVAA